MFSLFKRWTPCLSKGSMLQGLSFVKSFFWKVPLFQRFQEPGSFAQKISLLRQQVPQAHDRDSMLRWLYSFWHVQTSPRIILKFNVTLQINTPAQNSNTDFLKESREKWTKEINSKLTVEKWFHSTFDVHGCSKMIRSKIVPLIFKPNYLLTIVHSERGDARSQPGPFPCRPCQVVFWYFYAFRKLL